MGSKTISQEDIAPVLEKLKDHLISKNVAAEIAAQLCNSVAVKLDGKVFDHLHYLRLFCLLKKIFQSPFRNVRSLYRIPSFFFETLLIPLDSSKSLLRIILHLFPPPWMVQIGILWLAPLFCERFVTAPLEANCPESNHSLSILKLIDTIIHHLLYRY